MLQYRIRERETGRVHSTAPTREEIERIADSMQAYYVARERRGHVTVGTLVIEHHTGGNVWEVIANERIATR